MTTFVIVHGAWGGGWEWSPVADVLRRHGHRAFTPTLTGMGERAHLLHGEAVSLGTHIDDIVAVLKFERLRDVVLCGASYVGCRPPVRLTAPLTESGFWCTSTGLYPSPADRP